ncbi:MAG: hypothetical protein ACTSUO_08835 [Candidatus Thorarchaeota archaeon]
MNTTKSWTLKYEDGSVDNFLDIRRKVGNRVLRAYLLETLTEQSRIAKQKISLRGPKDEFKDSSIFLIVKACDNDFEFRILAEAGVYENMRIVGTDKQAVADKEPDDIIQLFTNALKNPEECKVEIVVSMDSRVKIGEK